MRVGFIGLLAEAIRLVERLGLPESALVAALPQGSATSRVSSLVAAGRSVASFIEMTDVARFGSSGFALEPLPLALQSGIQP
ncbi:hypothetical protein [Mycobacterium sp. Lab-001]|uniref:hypothetical protein n=1 Tax=Mycobacterium sp. Lab-001 TaxID=3410136 RepID=UPI003D177A75